jgi:hypothetical protein
LKRRGTRASFHINYGEILARIALLIGIVGVYLRGGPLPEILQPTPCFPPKEFSRFFCRNVLVDVLQYDSDTCGVDPHWSM